MSFIVPSPFLSSSIIVCHLDEKKIQELFFIFSNDYWQIFFLLSTAILNIEFLFFKIQSWKQKGKVFGSLHGGKESMRKYKEKSWEMQEKLINKTTRCAHQQKSNMNSIVNKFLNISRIAFKKNMKRVRSLLSSIPLDSLINKKHFFIVSFLPSP